MGAKRYDRPVIADYGTLGDLTEALSVNGAEDGMSKVVPIHHSAPIN